MGAEQDALRGDDVEIGKKQFIQKGNSGHSQ